MRLNRTLVLAISVALGWAGFVLGAFFLLIFWCPPFGWPPFNSWSASDQTQLFQAAVGLAGFGGGLIALFFAGQQLTRLLADPDLVVVYRWFEFEDYYGGGSGAGSVFQGGDLPILYTDGTEDELHLWLEIVNRSHSVCSLWQVVVSASQGVQIAPTSEWKRLAGGMAARQSASDEALFPDSPLPIGGLTLTFSSDSFVAVSDGSPLRTGRLTTKIISERRPREQHMDIRPCARQSPSRNDAIPPPNITLP